MARDLRDPLRPKEFALGLNDEIVILSLAFDKCCCLQVDAASSLLLAKRLSWRHFSNT
jgi:hypothetical protein